MDIGQGVETWGKVSIAVVISALSLLVSGLALGWNIYRDVILKSRVKIGFKVKRIIDPSATPPNQLKELCITATNFGPGKVKLSMIELKNAPLWRRLIGKTEYFSIYPDNNNPIGAQLPNMVDAGDQINLFLPYEAGCFLSSPCTHVGLSDSFGRVHWAPKKQVKEARRRYLHDFVVKKSV